MLDELGDVLVALHGDDAAGAGGDLLDVREGLLVFNVRATCAGEALV